MRVKDKDLCVCGIFGWMWMSGRRRMDLRVVKRERCET